MENYIRVIFSLLICQLLLFVELPAQLDWKMSNANKERTSCSKNENILAPPFDKSETYWYWTESHTFYDNTLYMGENSWFNKIIAVDYSTMDLLWSFDIDSSGGSIGFVPAVSEDIVLGGGQNSDTLYGINRITGEEIWKKAMDEIYARNPVIDENRVYIALDSLYCLNLQTGQSIWTKNIDGYFPCVDESQVYIGNYSNTYAFDKYTGELRWQRNDVGYFFGTVNEYAVYAGGPDALISLNRNNGNTIWEHALEEGTLAGLGTGAIAMNDRYLSYVIWANNENKGQMFTLDLTNGSEVWRQTFEVEGCYTPSIANGVVYLCSWEDGKLWGFDIENGDVLLNDGSRHYYGQAIVANHSLFIQSTEGLIEFRTDLTKVSKTLNSEKDYLVYPNPVSDKMKIQVLGAGNQIHSVLIVDMWGKKIQEMIYPGQQRISLDLSNMIPGSYYLQMDNSNIYPILIR